VSGAEIHRLSYDLWVWQTHDPTIKAELFSSAALIGSRLFLIDPIPLSEDQLQEISQAGPVSGVIVTNANHCRSALDYSERFSVPIFARPAAFPDSKLSRLREIAREATFAADLEVIEIEGAAPGEIALYLPANGGTLIVGDALINFEPYGFTLLPRRYCQNHKEMRVSLCQLLTKPAERMLFAHGTPVLSEATSRLRQLLGSE
jgi:glyoxylase-like metal-dependent hydrolase (beta-lactamase superfamily II)